MKSTTKQALVIIAIISYVGSIALACANPEPVQSPESCYSDVNDDNAIDTDSIVRGI